MKRIIIVILLFANNLLGQIPQAFNYQGVAFDESGEEIKDQKLGFRIALIKISDQEILYQEKNNATTTDNGIFSVNIGEGTVLNGNFSDINWSDRIALSIEMDITGGNNYTDAFSDEIHSVSYAITVANADVVLSGGLDHLVMMVKMVP